MKYGVSASSFALGFHLTRYPIARNAAQSSLSRYPCIFHGETSLPETRQAAATSRRPLRLRAWPLLPAPARESLAGDRRGPGVRRALARLERAHHRGVL